MTLFLMAMRANLLSNCVLMGSIHHWKAFLPGFHSLLYMELPQINVSSTYVEIHQSQCLSFSNKEPKSKYPLNLGRTGGTHERGTGELN